MLQQFLHRRSLARDVVALALIALGLTTFVTLLGLNAGGLMSAWVDLLRAAFGIGAFPLAIGMTVAGIALLAMESFRPDTRSLMQILGAEVAFLALLACVHSVFSGADEAGFARGGSGGGAVGWVLARATWTVLGDGGVARAASALAWLGLCAAGARWLILPIVQALRNRGGRARRSSTSSQPRGTARSAAAAAPAVQAPAGRPTKTRPLAPVADEPVPQPVAAAPAAKLSAADAKVQLTPHSARTVITGDKAKTTPAKESRPAKAASAKRSRAPAPSHELPPITLLKATPKTGGKAGEADVQRMADQIETTLSQFGLVGKVVEIRRGPTVTQFGVEPGYLDRGAQNREKVLQKIQGRLLNQVADAIVVELAPDRSAITLEAPAAIADARDIGFRSMLDAAFAKSGIRASLAKPEKRGARTVFEIAGDAAKGEKFKANLVRDAYQALVAHVAKAAFTLDDFSRSDMLVERLGFSFPRGLATQEEMTQLLQSVAMELGLAGDVFVDAQKAQASIEWQKQAQKVRVGQLAGLKDDLALALQAQSLRIEAPIPGRGLVGIEVPNESVNTVDLRAIMESEQFRKAAEKSPLAFSIGVDVSGTPHAADLARMPHLLIAGTTGSGKSVMISSIITCLAMNNRPEDLRMVMIDPKMVELSRFAGLPHILGKPESDMERIPAVLRWVTREMDSRYKKFAESAARNILDYNAHRTGADRLPYVVVFIDELADMMMQSPIETEKTICRLAQMARATGIHLVVATQRPSVDVVTGLIKANFPARMSFAVASSTDSRVILDQTGAEALLGRGDMLFQHPEAGAPGRLQGCFVSDKEVQALVAWWKKQAEAEAAAEQPGPEEEPADEEYVANRRPELDTPWDLVVAEMAAERSLAQSGRSGARAAPASSPAGDEGDDDDLIKRAMEIIQASGTASTSLLQRKLRIGYPRAARLMEELQTMGYVSAPSKQAGRTRDVIQKDDDT